MARHNKPNIDDRPMDKLLEDQEHSVPCPVTTA